MINYIIITLKIQSKLEGFFSPERALSVTDISEWDPNGLVTQSVDNLVPPEEIIRLNEVLKAHFDLLEMKAKTESGKNLGQVNDYLLDTETDVVIKYYLKDLLQGERIYPSDKVVKIDKVIIFSDDVKEIPPGAEGVTA